MSDTDPDTDSDTDAGNSQQAGEQLGIAGIAEAVKLELDTPFAEKLRLFGRYRILGVADGKPVSTLTDAAEAAGLGNTKGSNKTLASRHRNDPIVIQAMQDTRLAMQSEGIDNTKEAWANWRYGLAIATGMQQVEVNGKLRTVVDIKAAAKIMADMAKAAGVLDERNVQQTNPVIIAANPELSESEWETQYGQATT